MLKRHLIMPVLLVSSLSSIPHAYADWGDLLNNVTSAGKRLLSNDQPQTSALKTDTIIAALKQALDIASRQAIEDVSRSGGYLSNELIHIAMPPQLQKASDLMHQFGLNDIADQFEQSMNHAAEQAAPEAIDIIITAIQHLSISDANAILNGPDDAATEYFKQQTSDPLATLFAPIINHSLNQVDSTKYYNTLVDQIASIPFVGQTIDLDLSDYVTQQALKGLFTMIAIEEKKIRENPSARTTDLLKQVFGQQ